MHPARSAITEVDIRPSADAAVMLRMQVGTVLRSGEEFDAGAVARCTVGAEVHTITISAAKESRIPGEGSPVSP
jgi:hypothetical protein